MKKSLEVFIFYFFFYSQPGQIQSNLNWILNSQIHIVQWKLCQHFSYEKFYTFYAIRLWDFREFFPVTISINIDCLHLFVSLEKIAEKCFIAHVFNEWKSFIQSKVFLTRGLKWISVRQNNWFKIKTD